MASRREEQLSQLVAELMDYHARELQRERENRAARRRITALALWTEAQARKGGSLARTAAVLRAVGIDVVTMERPTNAGEDALSADD